MIKRFDLGVSLAACFGAMILGAVTHAEPMTYVMGGGVDSCGRFIAAIGKNPPGKFQQWNNTEFGRFVSENVQYQQWLEGFVSGFNGAHADEMEQQVKGIDIAGVDLWMRNWCNQHPTKTVFEGASAFINEMRTGAAAGQR